MGGVRETERPVSRSRLRAWLGMRWYAFRRRLLWLWMRRRFAEDRAAPLPCPQFSHATPFLRKLRDADMELQRNKIVNLKIAVKRLNGVVVHPGQVFSYWRLIGRPSRRRGYVDGMVLNGGRVESGVGGGLCQLSNLIFWMTLHTPLTVVERHRHGYDVFPDSDRTQPFGSGATCYYPHGDLMIRNDTDEDFQLCVRVGAECLEGEWSSLRPPERRYEIVEKNHEMRGEYWGGYSRRNELFRRVYDMDGALISEDFLLENHALMMYSPFLDFRREGAAF